MVPLRAPVSSTARASRSAQPAPDRHAEAIWGEALDVPSFGTARIGCVGFRPLLHACYPRLVNGSAPFCPPTGDLARMELLSFEESPMSRRRKSLPVYLTPAESERLLAAARSPRDRCLFAVMLLAGLRSAEACALRIERIDLIRGELLVFRGKGGRDRLLPISARLAPLLREQIGTRTQGSPRPLSVRGDASGRTALGRSLCPAHRAHRPGPRRAVGISRQRRARPPVAHLGAAGASLA